MHHTTRSFICSATLFGLALSGLTLWAAPVLPGARSTHPSLLGTGSLAKVKEVRLNVLPFPKAIRDAGMDEHEARRIWTDLLKAAEFEVVEDADAPHLIVEVLHKENPRVPDAIAIGYNVQFVQHVRVHRLEKDMPLPTYSDDIIALAPKMEAAQAARGGCVFFARRFVGTLQIASMSD